VLPRKEFWYRLEEIGLYIFFLSLPRVGVPGSIPSYVATNPFVDFLRIISHDLQSAALLLVHTGRVGSHPPQPGLATSFQRNPFQEMLQC
jgi:hypothetical protein